jgi:hypothetical protein
MAFISRNSIELRLRFEILVSSIALVDASTINVFILFGSYNSLWRISYFLRAQ